MSNWQSVSVFIGGKEITGIKSVTVNGVTVVNKTKNTTRRLRCIAEIILNKANLN